MSNNVIIEESEFIQDMASLLYSMEESVVRRHLRYMGREPEDEDAFINTLNEMIKRKNGW